MKSYKRMSRNEKTVATLALKPLDEHEMSEVVGGGQSSGAGAGKVTFNPFSITRKVDTTTPIFF